jgi:hypothetical protein
MDGAALIRISYKVYGKLHMLFQNELAFANPVRWLLIASVIFCDSPHRYGMLSPNLRYAWTG